MILSNAYVPAYPHFGKSAMTPSKNRAFSLELANHSVITYRCLAEISPSPKKTGTATLEHTSAFVADVCVLTLALLKCIFI